MRRIVINVIAQEQESVTLDIVEQVLREKVTKRVVHVVHNVKYVKKWEKESVTEICVTMDTYMIVVAVLVSVSQNQIFEII